MSNEHVRLIKVF